MRKVSRRQILPGESTEQGISVPVLLTFRMADSLLSFFCVPSVRCADFRDSLESELPSSETLEDIETMSIPR
jgi:hypothetical protein